MSAAPRQSVQVIPASLPMCSITGPVTLADGTLAIFATLTFDSLFPQIVSGQQITPLIVSAETDSTGQISLSLPQGLMVQMTVSLEGVTYPPTNAIIPLLSSIAFNNLPVLDMITGVPEAPNYNGPWGRMGSTLSWVPVLTAPSQTSGILAYNPATQSWVPLTAAATVSAPPNQISAWNSATNTWVAVYGPATINPANPGTWATGDVALAWDGTQSQWINVYPPALVNPPAGQANLTWNSSTNTWTPFTPTNVMPTGVTDGSNAAAGQVGEEIEAAANLTISTRLNESAWDGVALNQIGTLALTAGDWMVAAQIDMEAQPPSGPTTYVAANLTSTIGHDEWNLLRNVSAQDLTMHLGPLRANSAASFQFALAIEVVTTGAPALGPVLIWTVMRAWRMR